MAYESMTYEFILNRMMERVKTQYPHLDRREGSIIFNALAPAAVELAIMYTELDNAIKESFVDTASREYILRGCEQVGIDITQFEANGGIHKGVFDVEVPLDSRWNCELYNYTVNAFIDVEDGYYTYAIECETLGTAPNNVTGDLVPITDMPNGLTYAKVVECLIEGENETSDEDIRKTYYDYLNSNAEDGNVAQYKRWCEEYDGVGNYKILPLWNGDNTVKVSVLSASNKAASEELVAELQEYFDPGVTGMGDGVAPIGAFVTVTTATEVPIEVGGTVKLKDGYSDTTAIDTALEKYFADISYNKTLVSYMTVGAVILATEGVEFISDLVINGGVADITLGDEEIPVVGTTSWVVS